MMSKSIIAGCAVLFSAGIFAQIRPLSIQPNTVMPKDTITANRLMKSLNGFLALKEGENKENKYVLKEDLPETSLLLDELKEIEKSGKFKDDHFYKGYLTNVVPLDEGHFRLQFSYIGVNENLPVLVGSFEILAKPSGNQFYFYSPLQYHTEAWKTKRFGNVVFHFRNSLNEKSAKAYSKMAAGYDDKLQSKSRETVWYGCRDMAELLQNNGIAYKMIYNSRNSDTFSANENGILLIADGAKNEHFDTFDPHDLWHERLAKVLPKSITNKPVDEGCAYLYGGSWGISWKDILKTFKEKVAANNQNDWLSAYEQFANFGESKEKHLLVPYVINALIVQKIEKEKGFPAVLELLSCGKYQKGNENYFAALEKTAGITKSNFNETVSKLIKDSGK